MKITDVTLTLFAWDDIPPTTYGAHTGRFSGKSALGLLRLITDEGLEGHAFLGSAMNPATTDGQGLISHLKPVLIGKDPFQREHINQEIWKRQRSAGVRAIGAVDVALWDLVGKAMGQPIHRLLGTYRETVPAYASSAVLASPAEYAEDHIPGAINLPVLNNAERERVGTIYKQVSSFDAKKIGAALVSANISRHINAIMLDRPRDWRPLIYCWRGGGRSGAMAHVLVQIGWKVGPHCYTSNRRNANRCSGNSNRCLAINSCKINIGVFHAPVQPTNWLR